MTPATPAVDSAGVIALLERGRTLATPVLRAAVDRLAPPMDTVAAYHFGWIDAEGRPAAGDGGKAVRPALALLSAQAAGADPEVGVPGAVAVELVHNFSLLHDDLMDGDEQRRHRDTVWKVHGPAQAILVGDALFALAGEILLELGTVEAGRATRRLTSATRKLIDGQAQDISYEHRERVTVEECLEMEGNKTGALLACATSIGAVLGGADDRTADTLERYGYHLGLAFQAVDDVLGIWGDPVSTGKQTWSDLRQRKKSLPVVAALAAGRPGLRGPGADPRGRRAQAGGGVRRLQRGGVRHPRRADRGGGRPGLDLAGGPQAVRDGHRGPRRGGHARRGTRHSSWRSRTSSSSGRDDHYDRAVGTPIGPGRSRRPAPARCRPTEAPTTAESHCRGEAMTATTVQTVRVIPESETLVLAARQATAPRGPSTCSPARTSRAGGRATWRPTSPWTPRT